MNGSKLYVCTIKRDIKNCWKNRTVRKDFRNIKKRKDNNNTLIQNQQPKIYKVNTSTNNRRLLIEPSFSSKTLFMLKILSRIPDRDVYKITKSPPEQHSNSKLKTKERREEIKPLNEYEKAIIVFDDVLWSSSSRYIDHFLISGKHNMSEIYIYCNPISIYQKEMLQTIIATSFHLTKL